MEEMRSQQLVSYCPHYSNCLSNLSPCTLFALFGVHHDSSSAHSLSWKYLANSTAVFVTDAVLDDFAQVLHLNLIGIGSGLSSNTRILCEHPNAGFDDLDS